MRQSKKLLSLFLVFVMVFSVSMTAMAQDTYNEVVGTVTEIQKYGNLTMDIEPKLLYDAGYELGDILKVTVGENILEIPFCTSYSDVDTGSLVVRDDQKNNLLVVAINMGNFATTYNVNVGDKVTFSLLEKQGYISEYLLRQLTRTNLRSDYATDSIYANFRSITTTGIKPAVLYRSSSPINNEIARAAYANGLAEAVGIKTVLNLADSKEEINSYVSADDFNSEYYKSLYDAGNVITLNMGVAVAEEDFGNKLAEGLRFLIKNDGPYLIHCNEGKDRAGFVSALLEALMGASIDEIVNDYMITYENYYKLEKDSEQYKAVAESNIIASMTTVVAQLEKGADISKVDFVKAAENYLKRIGLTEKEIAAIKEKLSVDSIYKSPSIEANVIEIEKYGHAKTDLLIEDFNKLGFKYGDMVTAIFDNGFVLEAPYLDGYYVDSGAPLVRAYPGHTNVGVCINYGKLNEIANVEVGDKVTIMLTNPAEYQVQYEIRKLERTNNREDYSTDVEFANFRNIVVGNIAEGVLYRSSSPINNELGRAAYSDKLIKEAKVNTVVNLADSVENIENHLVAEDFASPYYAELYKNNKVLPLNMGLAYTSPEFKESIIKGLVFMSENEGPYHFHCTEGKDRAGFFAALVEALMGASKDEIVEDYMQSYINYFGVEKGTDKYNIITEDVIAMLKFIAGSEDLENVDLATGAKSFLLAGGMTEAQIETLKTKLSTPIATTEEAAVEEPVVEEPLVEQPAVEEPVVEEPAAEEPVVEEPAAATTQTYVVKSGDVLWRIARQFGTTWEKLAEFNSLKNPHLIFPGQKILIPGN
ncbi:protein tyrosine/serine phosphatase [Proteiniborus sp. DW1]|uniref:tyrosine-protein phosphatase n=1 Tax=Proteiniborus sp. DW1 TaxID=1889883 RepID=UPI00092E12C8|nr:tyrosine-protein phosphatase [Proteiniborus sp. DW1]SCG81871.1 protein tyrosine/serine phosphatase [Proteiniborus sp. DW1]